MPHGVILLTSPKNNNSDICSSSNLLVATFMQHLASRPTSALLLTTSSPLPSPLTVTSHPNQKGLTPLLALLLLHSWCFPHNLHFVTKSPVCRLSSRMPQALSYLSDHPRKTLKFLLQKWSFSYK